MLHYIAFRGHTFQTYPYLHHLCMPHPFSSRVYTVSQLCNPAGTPKAVGPSHCVDCGWCTSIYRYVMSRTQTSTSTFRGLIAPISEEIEDLELMTCLSTARRCDFRCSAAMWDGLGPHLLAKLVQISSLLMIDYGRYMCTFYGYKLEAKLYLGAPPCRILRWDLLAHLRTHNG